MSFSRFLQAFCRTTAVGLLAWGAASGAHAQETRELVIATTGGALEQKMRQHFFDPFTRATGIRVVTVSTSPADMRSNDVIRSGSPDHSATPTGLSAFPGKGEEKTTKCCGTNHEQ